MDLFHLNFPYDCFVYPSLGKCAIRNIRITGTGADQFSDAMILRIQSPLKDIRVVFLLCLCHSARIKMLPCGKLPLFFWFGYVLPRGSWVDQCFPV